MAKKPSLEILTSYLKTIENSVGSNLFRNLYFRIKGKTVDVLEDGDLSCANYVTAILHLFDLIKERHTTVVATIDDIVKSGWYEIKKPKRGALILWGFKKKDDGTQGRHRHVGFFIDSKNAISNDSAARSVARHHPTFGTFPNGEARRDILAYYWHDKLNQR
ncbi:hypothetical protein A2950_01370 [Candidatus Kaiserbacteria bacterium RIFCSPLOWO2_01_FULL_55_19]|uniref:Bacteriophage lysin domain-containing protein n=1 Tax=Candidatus Kaiserbacteria bacterium RIFCSPLOWO2_01_FULL_55_19 TaxID=1798516 RepID=A0A1F6ERU3_9BACT|nr:MAG: hypothetical protein A2950_01370 [Candidatus Kaiserbacteria bacterium RIFCSPLOWO2_01_FULL_55_19]